MKVRSEQIPPGTRCDCTPCENDATIGLLARGATGRWCEVMWVCETCGNKMGGGEILDAAAARELIDGMGGANWADF